MLVLAAVLFASVIVVTLFAKRLLINDDEDGCVVVIDVVLQTICVDTIDGGVPIT